MSEGGYFQATIKIAGTYTNNYPESYPEGLIRFAAEQAVEAFESHLLNREIAVMKISITDERIRYPEPEYKGAIA
jgi:hypothetical protein